MVPGPVLNDEDLAGTNAVVKQGICKSQAGVEEGFFLMVCQKKKKDWRKMGRDAPLG